MNGGPRTAMAAAGVLALAAGWAPGCAAKTAPAPLAEALVVVDTDLAAPNMAGRFRVDLYAEDGTWYVSRDIGRPIVSDWPVSFSVYSPDESKDTRVLVRLRVYPDALTRDYRGERYANRKGLPQNGPGPNDLAPRLFAGSVDITPASEPEPPTTVDRLVLLRLHPGVRGRVKVTLRGACLGTMPLLTQAVPYQKPDLNQAVTCVDKEAVLERLTEAALESDMSTPPSTTLGTFAADGPCDSSAPRDPRAVCVPSGTFVLGDKRYLDRGDPYDSFPLRAAAMHRFWLDRDEVSVGQVRLALGQGLLGGQAPTIGAHEGALGEAAASDAYPLDKWCTWSASPRGREQHPMNCIDWTFARSYCQFMGGDLPTEAQWEYAAGTAGRDFRTKFPASNAPPACADAVIDRLTSEGLPGNCSMLPAGPQPLGTAPHDVTPLGILDMAGSQAEIVRDTLGGYAGPCWLAASVFDPACTDASTTLHTLRGGSFASLPASAGVAVRDDSGLRDLRSQFGFRCAFDRAPGRP